jgi:hypothetical protein
MSNVYYVKLNAQNRVLKSKVYPNTTSDAVKFPPSDMIDITDQVKDGVSLSKVAAKVVNNVNKDMYFINGEFIIIDRYSFNDAIKLEKLLESGNAN